MALTKRNNIQSEFPLISLIIPVFQEVKLLESILLNYNFELLRKYNVELIISDGGSDDGTLQIAEKYADKIVKNISNKRQTIAEGRNKGAEQAIGKTLVFINGDSEPENVNLFLKEISNWTLGEHILSKFDALACPVNVKEDERKFKDKFYYYLLNLYIRFFNLLGFGMGRGECQIIKRNIFELVGGYNGKIAAGEDFDIFRRIAKIGKVAFAKNLIIFESPRRFRKYGYINTFWKWSINYISVVFFNRSISKEWEAIR